MFEDFSQDALLRYSKHFLLTQVGLEGQKKLDQASVLIVGAGGLGSPSSLYLAAAGIGRIGLVDSDRVDVSNLQRQILYGTGQVGQPKVQAARERLSDLNPHCQIDVFQTAFTAENAQEIAQGFEIIVDGTDNLTTRYLLNDLCVLTSRPYVFGAVQQFEGQMALFDSRRGPCYRCVFGDPPSPENFPVTADSGLLGVLPGLVGMLQATETLKIILEIGDSLSGKLVLINSLGASFEVIDVHQNENCPVCGDAPEITALLDYPEYCGVTYHNEPYDLQEDCKITPSELAERLQHDKHLRLVDVRTNAEREISKIPEAEWMPYRELVKNKDELDRDGAYVLFCRSGKTSVWALKHLQNAGFSNIRYLVGGINAWAETIDPSIPQY